MDPELTPLDWEAAQRVLRRVLREPTLADDRPEFRKLVAEVNRQGRKHARQQEAATRPPEPEARDLPRCYMCKKRYDPPHATHPALCVPCGEFNAQKREARADLTGRVALLTGGRIKIGYATSLRLLRDGARVIVTTRFPADAARRYAAEPDAHLWQGRLTLYGLDLRDLRAVQSLADHLDATEAHLDILVNNAAQTIARPPEFYAHLLAGERPMLPAPARPLPRIAQAAPLHLFGEGTGSLAAFPTGQLDEHGQQLDLRPHNSWTAQLEDVELRELLEVQLVNTSAPFLLCRRLLPLLRRSPHAARFIVNVSAVEGQFARPEKRGHHPHTNMAKAALNMLTLTSGPALAREGIYMTSVDTGWVSLQQPHPRQQQMAAEGFRLPLDLTDAASRIYDPIVRGLTGKAPFGVFLKDYVPQPW